MTVAGVRWADSFDVKDIRASSPNPSMSNSQRASGWIGLGCTGDLAAGKQAAHQRGSNVSISISIGVGFLLRYSLYGRHSGAWGVDVYQPLRCQRRKSFAVDPPTLELD